MENSILMNAPSNTSVTVPKFSAITMGVGLLVIVVVGVGAAVVFQYYKWHESPWWSDRFKASDHIWDWLDVFKTIPSLNAFGSVKEVPSALVEVPVAPVNQQISEKTDKPVQQNAWCFVGEDLTGRYCVKVPSSDACDRTRVYASQQDCELQSANSLPSGVVSAQDGRKMTPLVSGLLTP
jgi:hypothetical protein